MMENYVKILKEICCELGIEIQSFSDDWAFRLEKDGEVSYIYGYRFGLDLGSVQQFCTDKAITSDLLTFCKIPHVKHFFFMNKEDYYKKSAEVLLDKFCKVVCKANEGTGGNQVFFAENVDEMRRAATKIFEKGSTLAVSPYIEIEKEYRAVILDGEIKLIYSKERPFVVGDGIHTVGELAKKDGVILVNSLLSAEIPKKDEKFLINWKHNLGQGAIPIIEKEEKAIASVSELVRKLLQKVKICFASIDVIRHDGIYEVLEINSGVMMEHFSRVSRENYLIAKNIYKEAIMKMFDDNKFSMVK